LKVLLNLTEKILFILGVCLLIINIAGMFISLRNESIYKERAGIKLSEEELYQWINKPDTKRKEYIADLNSAVHKGIAHYWRDAGITKYNLRIPFYENYLLYIASYLDPEEYLKYEFYDYRRAIERGVGLCSQQAIIVSEILLEKGIPSFIIGLSGHVVLRAQVDANRDEWWILDPDYGVVIPHDIEIIEKNPKIIRSFYAQAGYELKTIDSLGKIYEKIEGYVVRSEQGAKGYRINRYRAEHIFYFLKWIIPCIFIITSMLLFIRRRRKTDM
jgi:hypothetical protein